MGVTTFRRRRKPRRGMIAAVGAAIAGGAVLGLLLPLTGVPAVLPDLWPFLDTRSGSTVVVSASALQVVDGDTVRYQGQRLRLLDIDAPETGDPRCAAEARAGAAATAAVRSVLAGQQVTIRYSGRSDRYRRPLVRISTGAGDVGSRLVAQGLALPYRGGSAAWQERAQHWCGPQAPA